MTFRSRVGIIAMAVLKNVNMMDFIDNLDLLDCGDFPVNLTQKDDTDSETELINKDIAKFEKRRWEYCKLPDHFRMWKKNDFLQRFRLNKQTVKFVFTNIRSSITPDTDR